MYVVVNVKLPACPALPCSLEALCACAGPAVVWPELHVYLCEAIPA